ncbi:MAG TPA: hypothetical protein VF284_02135 [Rhodanobacteraceae bacterium]
MTRRNARYWLCTFIIFFLAINLSGCFTMAYDSRHQAERASYEKVVLSDKISAIALLPKNSSGAPPVAFLGKKYSYVLTSGGGDLVKIAKAPFAGKVWVVQDADKHRLSLDGNRFDGVIDLRVNIPDADLQDTAIAKAMGFTAFFHEAATTYLKASTILSRNVKVAGRLAKPVQFEQSKLSKPINVSFWSTMKNPYGAGHAASVTADIALSPLYVAGSLFGVAILSVACSMSHSENPCVE